MGECKVLDTRSFDEFLSNKNRLIQRYDELTREYDEIVSTLSSNWKGRGADAFKKDAENVKANIAGIRDILIIMCDTLESCKEIFMECDTALGQANENALN